MSVGGGTANKQANKDYAKAFILKTISYPTKGTTTFEYDANRYKNTSNALTDGGGLRVKKVTNNIGGNPVQHTEYVYTAEPLRIPMTLENSKTTSFSIGYEGDLNLKSYLRQNRHVTIYSGWNPNLGANNPRYKNVTVYQGTSNAHAGKTEYIYSFSRVYWNLLQYSISTHNGMTETYSDLNDIEPLHYESWQEGLLVEKKDYKKQGSGFSLLKTTVNQYAFLNTYLEEKNVQKTCSYSFPDNVPTYQNPFLYGQGLSEEREYDMRKGLIGQLGSFQTKIYQPYNTKVNIGGYYISKTTDTLYNEGSDPIVKVTDYFQENPDHLYPTKVVTTTSATGETRIQKMKYPQDMTGSPYTNMVSQKNIVSPVIETKTFKYINGAEALLSTTLNEYKDWGGGIYRPELVKTAKGPGTLLEDRIVFHDYYDDGRIKEVSKKDGTHIVYIWGYNKQYPVAKVENATYSQIEGLAYFGSNFDLGDSGLSTDQENSLRANLSNAMVTTFTYDPLVGVTSVTDPKGYTTYYEYDNFNRLKRVKDADGNILSENDYHYKGQ
jgi:YD repeat-containing protein